MTPVDSFLHSVRGAFTPSHDTAWIGAVVLAAVAAIVPAVLFVGRWRARQLRGRAGEAAFAGFAAEKHLTGEQTQLLVRVAARIGASPLAVGASLDLFERATAQTLASETPTAASGVSRAGEGRGADDIFTRVHALRRALGFHVVPDHLALLTTRQLVPGTHVAVSGTAGEVMETNEAWFAVIAAPETTFAAGAPGTSLRITFTRDARYVSRCAVLAAEPPHAPRKLLFRHDEKPERHQLRAAVRVNAHGGVQLLPRPTVADPAEDLTIAAELVDISVGGMAVTVPRAVRPGTTLYAAIAWDGEVYRELPVVALRCDDKPGGHFLVRFEFRGLPATEEGRLAAAIARHSARVDQKLG